MNNKLSLISAAFATVATESEKQWLSRQSYFSLNKLVNQLEENLCTVIPPEQILDYLVPPSKDALEQAALKKFLNCAIKITCQFRPNSTRCQACDFKPLAYATRPCNWAGL